MFQKLWYFLMLILGSLMVISSNTWLNTWIGLEINLLFFISFIINYKNKFSSESAILYFIFQTLASMIFLFSIIYFMLFINNFILEKLNNKYLLFILISLMMKLGSSPFHFWMPMVMENLNWYYNFILMTWQKIAPLILIFYIMKYKYLLIFIILSSIISILGGMNQTSIRKLMAFSSINQISWLLLSLMINEMLWKMYFIFYCIINLTLIIILNNFNIYYLNQLFSMNMKNFLIKIMIYMNLLSLGGLPPFMGFFPKFLIIKKMMILNMYYLMMLVIIFSLIMMFFYLRLMYSSFLFNLLTMKMISKNFFLKSSLSMLSFMNNFLLMMLLILYF